MAELFRDEFTAADNTALATRGYTVDADANSSATVQSNQARLQSTANGSWMEVTRDEGESEGGILLDAYAEAGSGNKWFAVFFRGGYALGFDIGSRTAILYRTDTWGTVTTVANFLPANPESTPFTLRVEFQGTAIRARAWATGGSEGGSWTLNGTDSAFSGSEYGFFLEGFSSSTRSWFVDNLSYYDFSSGGPVVEPDFTSSFTPALPGAKGVSRTLSLPSTFTPSAAASKAAAVVAAYSAVFSPTLPGLKGVARALSLSAEFDFQADVALPRTLSPSWSAGFVPSVAASKAVDRLAAWSALFDFTAEKGDPGPTVEPGFSAEFQVGPTASKGALASLALDAGFLASVGVAPVKFGSPLFDFDAWFGTEVAPPPQLTVEPEFAVEFQLAATLQALRAVSPGWAVRFHVRTLRTREGGESTPLSRQTHIETRRVGQPTRSLGQYVRVRGGPRGPFGRRW